MSPIPLRIDDYKDGFVTEAAGINLSLLRTVLVKLGRCSPTIGRNSFEYLKTRAVLQMDEQRLSQKAENIT